MGAYRACKSANPLLNFGLGRAYQRVARTNLGVI
jgi:hypothetical protein